MLEPSLSLWRPIFFEAHFQLTASSLITSASGEPNDWRKNLAIFPGKSLENIIIYGLNSFERLLSILVCLFHEIMRECARTQTRVTPYAAQFSDKETVRVCIAVYDCSSYLQPFKCFKGVFLFQLSTFIKFCFLSLHSFKIDPQVCLTDGVEQLPFLFSHSVSVCAALFRKK